METKMDLEKQRYIERLKDLYQEVEKWIKQKGLVAKEQDIEINEEVPGRYKAPALTIQSEHGEQVAELLPIGAWIIGAEGRVDLIGKLDRTNLVFLQMGGPVVKKSLRDSIGKVEEVSRPLFKGVSQAGWYWIGESRRGRAHPLTKELFLDLLSEVSDYDVR
jgi:hypothetical protein